MSMTLGGMIIKEVDYAVRLDETPLEINDIACIQFQPCWFGEIYFEVIFNSER